MNKGLFTYTLAAFIKLASKQYIEASKSSKGWRDWFIHELKSEEPVKRIRNRRSGGFLAGSAFSPPDEGELDVTKTYGELNPEPAVFLDQRTINLNVIEQILATLAEADLIEEIPDPVTDTYFKIYGPRCEDFLKESSDTLLIEVAKKFDRAGNEWFKEAVTNLHKNPNMYQLDTSVMVIPASDRIVELNHNLPEHSLIQQNIQNFKEEVITSSNKNSLTDKEEAALSDIDAGLTLWQRSTLHVRTLKHTLISGIKELAKETQKASIKEAAKALLAQIIKFLSGLG